MVILLLSLLVVLYIGLFIFLRWNVWASLLACLHIGVGAIVVYALGVHDAARILSSIALVLTAITTFAWLAQELFWPSDAKLRESSRDLDSTPQERSVGTPGGSSPCE